MIEQGEREAGKFPGAHVSGEQDDSSAAALDGIEVFEAFAINDAFQSLRIGICELAEHAEQSTQILKAAAQQTPVLARAQIWKRQPQVALARASQPGGKIVGAPGHD